MADDTVAYLDDVVDGPTQLVGWSDGAVVALLVAMHRPDLVDRLVLIGQYCNSSGKVTNGIVDQLLGGGDEVMACLRGGYDPFHRTARSSAATRTAGGSPGYASLADGDSESGECAADLVPRWR
jgi:pimeloyl-ACP methyl ester carboxylesterase